MAVILKHPLPDESPQSDPAAFDVEAALSRTLGYVTPQEIRTLMNAKVAIAGLGGVGGTHLQTLTRLGIGKFHIADFDRFEIQNFNRQAGATVKTINQAKTTVMNEFVHDINPRLDVTVFDEGVTPENIDAFLEGVDLYVDGLDFFAFEARALVFQACYKKGIPAITVAPLGMGAALINFLPRGMTFEQYFRWSGKNDYEKGLHMLVGLAPKATHRHYLVWPEVVSLRNRRGPSTPIACALCAGVAATEALKILLKRGKVRAAPHSIVFDAYFNRTIRSWVPGGLRNPFMRLRLMIVRAVVKNLERNNPL